MIETPEPFADSLYREPVLIIGQGQHTAAVQCMAINELCVMAVTGARDKTLRACRLRRTTGTGANTRKTEPTVHNTFQFTAIFVRSLASRAQRTKNLLPEEEGAYPARGPGAQTRADERSGIVSPPFAKAASRMSQELFRPPAIRTPARMHPPGLANSPADTPQVSQSVATAPAAEPARAGAAAPRARWQPRLPQWQ